MKNDCLVSVIMPVYNAQEYIEKAILSIVNQTYKNIELICIDDASLDSSYEICKRLSCVYNNIVLLKHMNNGHQISHNLGQEATRNLGLNNMKGKYFLFLDSDDTLHPKTIETMVTIAEKTKVDFVMCGYSEIVNNEEKDILAHVKSGVYSSGDISRMMLNNISWEVGSCIGSKLYRTEFARKNNLHFKKIYKFNEDAAFFLEALLNSNSIYYINYPFYKYLIRVNNSIMSSYRKNMFISNVRVVELLKLIFEKNNCFKEKSKLYYVKLYDLMIDSLKNEIRYSNSRAFFHTTQIIRNYKEFEIMYNNLRNEISIKRGVLLYLLKSRSLRLLYFILKFRNTETVRRFMFYKYCDFLTSVLMMFYQGKCFDSVVYMFHNISDKCTDPDKYRTNIQDFEKFIQLEIKKRRPIGIDKLRKVPMSSFVITFDDGYEGVYSLAYPFLTKMNIPFTVFVTKDYLNKPGYIRLNELLEMSKNKLCTIGSHSISHPLLRFCKNPRHEIEGSKKILERLIHKRILYFAFPYGSIYACGNRSIKCAKQAGYKMAFSSIKGRINSRSIYNSFYLPRVNGDPVVCRCGSVK